MMKRCDHLLLKALVSLRDWESDFNSLGRKFESSQPSDFAAFFEENQPIFKRKVGYVDHKI